MSYSPILGLSLTSSSDQNKKFKTWRTEMSDESSSSNMMKIDTAIGNILDWQDETGSTPITCGMLKYGLGYTPTQE